ncbi:uncharacterized protein LOC128870355 [Anastrepha ludens]|uniref:uncharacterized protein LOC128870355 n=1 Tax=Anastrepha ludens TaxID=28586 RepID=UPI0023AFA370|nr:uncharacterized protein LOC128870355 [Anastrepha ludens]
MDAKKDAAIPQTSGTTLRRPAQFVKKRSGSLVDALDELHREIYDKPSTPVSAPKTSIPRAWVTQVTPLDVGAKLPTLAVTASSSQPARRRPTIKEKEKKRERWLLTRKTWKYMTDAGRKLIPDGAQNRKEDIPKIEVHFQQTCSNEPRFILWPRKSSYPGAVRNSKRRIKHFLQHTGQKGPLTNNALKQEQADNADLVIGLLQSYLKLDEVCKTTTLLSSKTIRPDQTASPSAQRPGRLRRLPINIDNITSRGPGFLTTTQRPKDLQELNEIDQLLEQLRILSCSSKVYAFTIPPESITPAILEDKGLLKQIYNLLKKQQLHRLLSKHSTSSPKGAPSQLEHSSSLSSLLHFGAGASDTGRFGNKERCHVISTAAPMKGQIPLVTTTSETIKTTSGTIPKIPLRSVRKDPSWGAISPIATPRQRKPPSSLHIPGLYSDNKNSPPLCRTKPLLVEKHFNCCGSQTNFVSLQEIKRLAEEYKQRKREEITLNASSITTPAATDDEAEKGGSTTLCRTQHHSRKGSIDNEDISQSVSDTIKRYLRMARRKSVHDDDANRFKRVNYDRNLRNIKAKGEINPPGMDEGNSKAVQTLDAWPLISLDFIRGNEKSGILEAAHIEWRRALEERMQKKLEYEQNLNLQTGACDSTSIARDIEPSVSSCNSSSAPTSPISNETVHASKHLSSGVSGLRLVGSQFLSNLWHGASSGASSAFHDDDPGSSHHVSASLLKFHRNGKSNQNTGNNDSSPKNVSLGAVMQKSKSSSNVGQFVTRKILKRRSKSQSRSSTQTPFSKWEPAENFTWASENGDRLLIQDSCLQNLTDIEAKILRRVALEKISELNIGANVLLGKCNGKCKVRGLT